MTDAELISICRDLLRIDTRNPGSTEEQAAAYVTDFLAARGIASEVVEPEPGRCSVVSRMPGSNRTLPALLVHCHLDVVPPQDEGWSHDPFGGVVADGFLWGRGAVDMKGFAAMMLASQHELAARTEPPTRDVVFAYFADEEMGGGLGSRWLADRRPDLFEGVTEAVGEIGGFAVPAGSTTVYPIQVAEKGMLWLRITIPGSPGHAAYRVRGNPLERLAGLIGQVVHLRAEGEPLDASLRLRDEVRRTFGAEVDDVPLGGLWELIEQSERTTFVPTVVRAGDKINVVPDHAVLTVDCRFVPGSKERALRAVRSLLDDDMTLEVLQESDGLDSRLESELFASCRRAVLELDPDGVVVPFVMPAGTDAQRLAVLGIAGYGFTPLTLPPGFDYLGLFHAPDERVPVAALTGGWEIFRSFLSTV
jgi:acetylornithine deacetylase/succinyl-diaminopimelate desuccinylase-like protein